MSSLKRWVGVALLVVGLVLGAKWIMGAKWGPFVDALKKSAQDQLENLVAEEKLALSESRAALEKAKEKARTLKSATIESKAGLEKLDRDLNMASQTVSEIEADLVAIQRRIEAGLPVRLVSGRQLSNEQAALRVQHTGQRLELAHERIRSLEELRNRRVARVKKLEAAQEQIPFEVAQLELSVQLLSEKVQFYEEWQQHLGEEEDAEAAVASLLGDAQRTLENAHAAVDSKLARVDAILDTSLTDPIAPVTESSVESADVLAEIRRILSSDPLAAADTAGPQ